MRAKPAALHSYCRAPGTAGEWVGLASRECELRGRDVLLSSRWWRQVTASPASLCFSKVDFV